MKHSLSYIFISLARPIVIGGRGSIVNLNETCVSTKRKYQRGRVHPDYWVLGGVDRITKRWFARIVLN